MLVKQKFSLIEIMHSFNKKKTCMYRLTFLFEIIRYRIGSVNSITKEHTIKVFQRV